MGGWSTQGVALGYVCLALSGQGSPVTGENRVSPHCLDRQYLVGMYRLKGKGVAMENIFLRPERPSHKQTNEMAWV